MLLCNCLLQKFNLVNIQLRDVTKFQQPRQTRTGEREREGEAAAGNQEQGINTNVRHDSNVSKTLLMVNLQRHRVVRSAILLKF